MIFLVLIFKRAKIDMIYLLNGFCDLLFVMGLDFPRFLSFVIFRQSSWLQLSPIQNSIVQPDSYSYSLSWEYILWFIQFFIILEFGQGRFSENNGEFHPIWCAICLIRQRFFSSSEQKWIYFIILKFLSFLAPKWKFFWKSNRLKTSAQIL